MSTGIQVNPDSFTMLEIGRLKYRDHFEHNLRYLQPIKQRIPKIKRKWLKIKRLLGNPETASFVHPILHSLCKRRRRRKVGLPLAKRLIRRTRVMRTRPSYRPFVCTRCGLESFHFSVIEKHGCRKRKFRPHTKEECK
jgi:hypothetical protein